MLSKVCLAALEALEPSALPKALFHRRNLDARLPSIPRDLALLLLRLARVRLTEAFSPVGPHAQAG